MKVSVIVTTYKDLDSLAIVLQGLQGQDYKDFEVVIAEDDDDPKTAEFLKGYTDLDIVHISHPNIGRTKTVIQNKAIIASSGEYLIFLDGDVYPYSQLISAQVKVAQPKQILAGRRVNLNEKISQKIREGKLNPAHIERYYWLYALQFMFDKQTRFEQGFFISPDSWIYKNILAKRTRSASILGCNFSCFKEDIVAINGFDESYEPTTLGDDTDLTRRFRLYGCRLASSKNIANVLHLWHTATRGTHPKEISDLFQKNTQQNSFAAQKGLSQYE